MDYEEKKRKNIKINAILLCVTLIIVAYFITSIITYATTETLPIVCTDTNLYNKLTETIPKEYILSKDAQTKTINIKEGNLANITKLTLSGADITNINGLQALSYLTELDISDNNITSISDLNSLSNLQKLNISNNSITNITPISILTNLTELNVSSNRISDITALSNLTNLTILDLSVNSISNVSTIQKLTKLQNLNLSQNSNVTNIDDTLQSTLISLNLSGTGIKKIKQNDADEKAQITQKCTKLEELYLADTNITDIYQLFDTMTVDYESVPCLINLKKFDYSNPHGATIDVSNFYNFTNLEELYLPGNSIYNISSIYNLEKLQTLNLANNNITDLSGLIDIEYNDNGSPYVSKYSKVKNLILEKNNISDISILSNLKELKVLNLKSNNIYNITPIENLTLDTLYLQKQTINMDVYRKQNELNQYIILLNLFQSVKNPNSIIYDENVQFELTGVTLNTTSSEYQKSPYYNVVIPIEYDNYEERDLSVKINGGDADESVIKFNMTDSTDAIDSLYFEDQNLDKAIYDYLINNLPENAYIARAPFIINIEKQQILNIGELDLSSHDISNIKGLSNFSNLNSLNLSDNNISDDSEIKYLTNLNILYLTNNKLNGKYTSIENLYYLKTLGLSGNNIESLNSLEKLIKNTSDNYSETQLSSVILSNNQISDINVLSKIPTLENIDISGNDVSDISVIKNNNKIKTLNISNNNITDINVIKNFADTLNTFNASKNNIKDISVIKNVSLTELNLSSNKIEDITPIKSQTMLKTLDLSSNNIQDIQSLESLSIGKYNFKQQKIMYALSDDGDENIALPNIFKQSKTSSSKVYSNQDYETENCTLSSDLQYVIVNKENLNGQVAKVIIKGGQADGTTFTIAEAIKGTITYSKEELTNSDVTASISFNRQGATITNNNGNNTYVFTQNGEFTFYYQDENGFEASSVAKVTWIDKTPPKISNIQNGTIYGNPVTPTITDENLGTIELKKDGEIVPNYQSGDTISELGEYEMTATDLAGNVTTIKFSIAQKNVTIQSTKYKVDNDNGRILNINPNTDLTTFIGNINTDKSEYSVKDKNNNTKNNTDKVATGDKLVTSDEKEFVLCVAGDVNGDGKSDIKDIFAVNKHRLNTATLENEYCIAGDVNFDGKVDIKDIFKINKYRLGTITTYIDGEEN